MNLVHFRLPEGDEILTCLSIAGNVATHNLLSSSHVSENGLKDLPNTAVQFNQMAYIQGRRKDSEKKKGKERTHNIETDIDADSLNKVLTERKFENVRCPEVDEMGEAVSRLPNSRQPSAFSYSRPSFDCELEVPKTASREILSRDEDAHRKRYRVHRL